MAAMRTLHTAPASFIVPPAPHLVSPTPTPRAGAVVASVEDAKRDVLIALSQIIDPDFGTDIVSCGFIKDLEISETLEEVSFRVELTTPACPVKDMFEEKANEVVVALPWVKKGGVGKSTVAVNLAYTLAGMGARVGIFDADVFGPSLPNMVSPVNRLLVVNPENKSILPTEYLGVKLVSFGFAGQGRAIMRGPMVSGVINQLLTTTDWGELDYLVIDMPPGTGDIHLTLCQVVAPLTAAVIVTTPQKLAFIDVAKGVRMFSKLKVVQQFGIPNLFDLPIRPTNLGVCVVQQCAKIRQQVSTAVSYDRSIRAIRVKVPDSDEEFFLHPATVRRNDRSAQSVDEWTGEQKVQYGDVPEDIEPEEIRPMGNYAVSITWPDGFSQIAPYDQLDMLERTTQRKQGFSMSVCGQLCLLVLQMGPALGAGGPAAIVQGGDADLGVLGAAPDCLEIGRGEIPARLADAGSGDT
ncbi:Protein mrp-like protein [Triticum urartu]|uniref:Protein mrp-like protein n=1 Tax=Triticum urartu TaxID=4572 RepID=M7ZUD0_TRIUA|nr:Protein mrp-like protein [Triticum urartu]